MKKLITLVFLVGNLVAQSPSGYINYDSVYTHLPEYANIQGYVDQRVKEMTDTLDIMYKDYQNRSAHPNTEVPESLRTKNLEKARENIINYEKSFIDKRRLFQTLAEQKLNNTIKQYTSLFCKEKGIPMLWDKNSIHYCADCKDYTLELIQYILQK